LPCNAQDSLGEVVQHGIFDIMNVNSSLEGARNMLITENKEIIIARKVIIADTFLRRFVGLMGKLSLASHEALMLVPCSQVHTMFMFFPLDLLFLDEDMVIVKIVYHLRPFSISPNVKNAKYVVEMKSGTLEGLELKEGERVILNPKY